MVTVKKLEAAHLPEVDDALARSLGIADGTVAALHEDISKNLQREVKARLLSRNKQGVMEALISKSELDLPKASVQAEVERLVADARANLKQRGIKDADNAPIPEELFTAQAERRVRLGLVVGGLVRAKGFQVDEAEDGAVAVDKVRHGPQMYSAILMDFVMPVMDGPTATKHIREQLAYTAPILGVTGNGQDFDVAHFKTCGATGASDCPRTNDLFIAMSPFTFPQRCLRNRWMCHASSRCWDRMALWCHQVQRTINVARNLILEWKKVIRRSTIEN
jgi:CheY-like chemotaxis protein